MAEPRFMIVRGTTEQGVSSPEWPTVEDPFAVLDRQDGIWFSWRLLSGNNRELGRGAMAYGSQQVCLAAIVHAQTSASACTSAVGARSSGHWWWQLELNGDRIAVAGRVYQRQRECRYNLGQFLLALPVALPPAISAGTLTVGEVSDRAVQPARLYPPRPVLTIGGTAMVPIRRTRSAP